VAGYFDEIMIVNPINQQGEKRMRFYPMGRTMRNGRSISPRRVVRRCPTRGASGPGYIAEAPDQMGYVYEAPESFGYVYEVPEPMGYYGEAPEVLGYATGGVGYISDPPPGFVEGTGYYADAPEVGYYAAAPEFAGMGYIHETPDEMGYYSEASDQMGYVYEVPDQMGYYAEAPDQVGYYAETPDQMGYVYEAPEQMGYYAEVPDQMGYVYETPDQMGYYAEAPVEGYIREQNTSPRVLPLENINGVEGYQRPQTINPTCENIRPAEDQPKPGSSWFQPLW
jgi:hypothetical protein